MKRALPIALLALALCVPAARAGPAQPDIVVILVDDLGAVEYILDRLPAISDLFIENGLAFDNAYSETPLCCPGRASFVSGKHTRRPDGHGVYTNDEPWRLDPTHTVATALHDGGYYTEWDGKYLNANWALEDFTPVGWDRFLMLNWDERTQTSDWYDNDVPLGSMPFDDRYLAEQASLSVAAAPTDKPLFLVTAPRGPHAVHQTDQWWDVPVEPSYEDDARCADIAPWKPPSYSLRVQPNGFPLDEVCEAMLTIDDMVAGLRVAIAKRGRPTLWMFTSDNGMSWGEHGFSTKSNPWSVHLPLYFSGTGVTPGRTSALVSMIDFGPTLADIGGTTMPYAHGVPFTAVLSGGTGGRQWMLEDYPARAFGGQWRAPWWGIRTPGWHLWARRKNGAWVYSLHNLRTDPWERINLKSRKPKKFRELRALYPYPL